MGFASSHDVRNRATYMLYGIFARNGLDFGILVNNDEVGARLLIDAMSMFEYDCVVGPEEPTQEELDAMPDVDPIR